MSPSPPFRGRGRGPRRRRGRVRWASAAKQVNALESPTSPQPSPPPGAERELLAASRAAPVGGAIRPVLEDDALVRQFGADAVGVGEAAVAARLHSLLDPLFDTARV